MDYTSIIKVATQMGVFYVVQLPRMHRTRWGNVVSLVVGSEGRSRPISRVLSCAAIHLGRVSPHASCDLPGIARAAQHPSIWSCSRRGLPCREPLPVARCALTAPFHPCRLERVRRFAFCCTFRRLAPPRDYLAPCPAEPGLSSVHITMHTAAAWPTPHAHHSIAGICRRLSTATPARVHTLDCAAAR